MQCVKAINRQINTAILILRDEHTAMFLVNQQPEQLLAIQLVVSSHVFHSRLMQIAM